MDAMKSSVPRDDSDDKRGEFTSLVVRRDGCPSCVSIIPDGLWVSGQSGEVMASVQMQDGQPVLAVGDHRKAVAGHQIALTVDKDGTPCIQVVLGEKIVFLSGKELLDKLGG